MRAARDAGLTLEAYARNKRLPVAFLHELGVRTHHEPDRPSCVVIPYRDAAGRVVFTKYRGAGKPRFWCDEGAEPVLYGLHRLANAEAGKAVLLVEGESDCHTGWYYKLLVLGVPGAGAWQSPWARLVAGRPSFAWREPGKGGETFIARLAADLDNLRVIQAPEGVKDLSDLHLQDQDGFLNRLANLVSTAVAPPPPVPHSLSPSRGKQSRHRRGCRCDRCTLSPDRSGHSRLNRPLPVEGARSVPILEVAARLGLGDPRRVGREYVVRCPFHDDERPSLRVDPNKNLWYCDPCAIGGDGIELWQRLRDVDFPTAVKEVVQ